MLTDCFGNRENSVRANRCVDPRAQGEISSATGKGQRVWQRWWEGGHKSRCQGRKGCTSTRQEEEEGEALINLRTCKRLGRCADERRAAWILENAGYALWLQVALPARIESGGLGYIGSSKKNLKNMAVQKRNFKEAATCKYERREVWGQLAAS